MMNFSQFFLMLTLFLSFNIQAIVVQGTVSSIHDGDTLRMRVEGIKKEVRVRFMGVDTPEIDFKGYTQGALAYEARDYLLSLLPIGAQIRVETGDEPTDKNNRLLGTIFYNDININKEMLRSGLAAMYFIAPYNKEILVDYINVAKEAFFEKRGMFQYAKSDFSLPYIFRMEVQGFVGSNLVGNYETKELFHPEEVERVPPYARVFFQFENMAQQRGFKWRD